MKKKSIKFHLAPYSILQKRRTTINHAFAAAIAPVDRYDEAELTTALTLLGQDPDGDLHCVFCELRADTWDHLIGLVKEGELRGYGHQIGNLVPCCGRCNSKKGSKDWEVYLREVISDQSTFEKKHNLISFYLNEYAIPVNLERTKETLPNDWKRYDELKQEILRLMAEADKIAIRLRNIVATKQ